MTSERVVCTGCGSTMTDAELIAMRKGDDRILSCCPERKMMLRERPKESYSTDGPKCPACGYTFTPDESHYYDEQRYTDDECQDCGCKFKVEVNISTSWSCEEIPPADA